MKTRILIAIFLVLGRWQIATADGPPNYDTSDGVALNGMSATYPQSSESGYNWSLALRYTKAKLLAFGAQEHNLDGSHKTNFLTTTMIQDGQVTEAKLSGGVQTKLNAVGGTNTVSTLIITNALTYITSTEGTILNPLTATETAWASATLSSNKFRKVMIAAEVMLDNGSGGSRTFTVKIKSGGLSGTTVANLGPFKLGPNNQILITPSTIFTGGNSADVLYSVTGYVTGGAGCVGSVNNLRLWGIP